MRYFLLLLCLMVPMMGKCPAAETDDLADGINQFGLDLHSRLAAKGGNAVFSPLSIETALAMTYAGAAGNTKLEMAKVLHFPADDATVHQNIAKISTELLLQAKESQRLIRQSKKPSEAGSAFELQMANRLFGQKGYTFKAPFLKTLASNYGSPLQTLDFTTSPSRATKVINSWVSENTKGKIKDLIPSGTLKDKTRLVLANAMRLKARWTFDFSEVPNEEFYANGSEQIRVPMLVEQAHFGYQKISKGVAVTIPYQDSSLQMVLLVPNSKKGLEKMEKKLTAETLRKLTSANTSIPVNLRWPKFKLAPNSIALSDELKQMGMPSAFDKPTGSSFFTNMAPPQKNESLFISEVIHKAFIAVDKDGTEAAAATAVVMSAKVAIAPQPRKVIPVTVDRPFAFAIQDKTSGACLFFGRVVDPR